MFLGTVEPTDCNGLTCNPTKSICDQFVFNTVITRAQSLVVAVGNPFMLLRMEQHNSKKCWREYLNFCSLHKTLLVSSSANIQANDKIKILKAKLSNSIIRIPLAMPTPRKITMNKPRHSQFCELLYSNYINICI